MKKFVGAVLSLILLIGVATLALPSGASSTRSSSPTCNSVSVALVRKSLGGSPSKPTTQTSAGVLICHYGIVDLIYLLHQNKAIFHADEVSNKGKSVAGLGKAAFTYSTKGSTVTTLQVLDGTVTFIISGSSANFKQRKTLAKKMLPLV